MGALRKRFTGEEIVAAIIRLGRARLREECERTADRPREGTKWSQLNAGELAAELLERLPTGDYMRLAAEGLARQRTPSVGGPSWSYGGRDPLNAETAAAAISAFTDKCSDEWTEVKADIRTHEMLEGVVYLEYTSYSIQSSGEDLIRIPSLNTAMILLDYGDQVSTVSARSDEDALFIGNAWAVALGSGTAPVQLILTPSVSNRAISQRSVQMLEAVYGRIGSVGHVVNVDRIWTKRQDPASPVQEQMARGEANHVLLDEDVIRSLNRGDDITGLAFQVDWMYHSKGQERHYISHVTISSETGPLILRVTRAGHSFELASALYQALRRALSRGTGEQGKQRLQSSLEQLIGRTKP